MRPSYYTPFSILSRYLTRQFVRLFAAIASTFIVLYVVIDLFDRLDILLKHDATIGASVRYFLFKVPLMVTHITPPAVITAVLLTLGLLSRNNEIIALRATGVSLTQTALPLIVIVASISVGLFVWNETVVPYSTRQFQFINNVEIRKRAFRGILSDRHIWYHGKNGFYNIEHVDKDRQVMVGLTIYRLDDEFQLIEVTEVERAEWRDGRWHIPEATRIKTEHGELKSERVSGEQIQIPETLGDFLVVQREPEEMSFTLLRSWIATLTERGIDASHLLVDLHLKLAVPFASAVLGLIAIPISGRARRYPSLAAIMGIGLAVGFGYWILLGFATSLGQSGALPAVVAAWSANAIYLLIAIALFLSTD